ncbi:MAG TPA: alpha/beta fold hydrolase [Candidatus Dormibacteraeota bacterium]|nr:alpha/beta fold hydrolase [Candidatus Dormibacteraeota bacterium]
MDEVVTLLHGFTLNGASWDDLLSRMPKGWKWLTPDLRSSTMDDCAADLVEMWDHLGVERSHVVGYSMGGRLALHVAVRLPERTQSLFTIGAHAGLGAEARAARRETDEALAQRIEAEGIESFVTYWEGLPMFAGIARRGPRFLAWLHAIRVANTAKDLAASLRGMGAGAMEPLWDRLDAVTCPSTFIAGEQDEAYVAHARRLSESVSRSRLEIVADSGHSVQFEQPNATASSLADHLRWAASATSSSTTA